jgi:DNA polymerase III, delta subunit
VTTIVGHERARTALAESLPQAAMLRGPESVGKMTLAKWLAAKHASLWNQMIIERLTVDKAREIRSFLYRPHDGLAVVVISLDNTASEAAYHALLKELEEPPPHARFLLVASAGLARPPATVVSRCRVYVCGLLSYGAVAEVLQAQGVPPARAHQAAPVGHGRVAPALAAARSESFGKARSNVLGLLKALATGDRDLLNRVLAGWGGDEHYLLSDWITEAISGRWRIFSQDESAGLGAAHARKLLAGLAKTHEARPRLAIAVVSDSLLSQGARS